jgi:hypothetical protein
MFSYSYKQTKLFVMKKIFFIGILLVGVQSCFVGQDLRRTDNREYLEDAPVMLTVNTETLSDAHKIIVFCNAASSQNSSSFIQNKYQVENWTIRFQYPKLARSKADQLIKQIQNTDPTASVTLINIK